MANTEENAETLTGSVETVTRMQDHQTFVNSYVEYKDMNLSDRALRMYLMKEKQFLLATATLINTKKGLVLGTL